jgi:hypothetical protein
MYNSDCQLITDLITRGMKRSCVQGTPRGPAGLIAGCTQGRFLLGGVDA